jgi:VIT1/CCC1 family predicted Fe2+/Mn2+ transporter
VAGALIIILAFSCYVSVAKDLPFWRRFGEMAGLSLGVAAVSFGVGYLLRAMVGVDV